nr:HTTM domain-containing protein [Fertoeibacter niger]
MLSRPVSSLSLAAFRIGLGAMLVWDCWRFIQYDRIHRYFVEPEFNFSFSGLGWVTPLPEPWIHLAWCVVGLSALCVMLGLFYRVSIVILTMSFAYFFLLDKAEYLNHFYLVLLFLVLMCFLPAHRALSLDARWRRGVASDQVPYAAVFILRAQMEIMLVFAGLVKITPDWLAGEPLGLWLRDQSDAFPFGFLFHYDWVIIAGTWTTVALHVLGAPLLLWRKTRLPTFVIYCAFHMANAVFFNIGIFPWLTIAATTIFFDPDWPRQLAQRLVAPFGTLVAHGPTTRVAAGTLPRGVMIGLVVWIAIQIALPLRAGLIPGEVRWTGDGHRFSWRMRIYDRQADGAFRVVADGQEYTVDPARHLTDRQVGKMLVRPDMIHQFAGYLKSRWTDAGYRDVAVYADIWKSLNGRPMQPFINPEVDLTSVTLNRLGPDPWVMPLREPVWGVADNRLKPGARTTPGDGS